MILYFRVRIKDMLKIFFNNEILSQSSKKKIGAPLKVNRCFIIKK